MIAAAMDRGEDTSGLCTVREAAALILEDEKRDPIEMFFDLEGRRVNVLVTVLTPGADWKQEEVLRLMELARVHAEQAVAAERERCAKVCEKVNVTYGDYFAAAIRAG
jgi:hypothetical protein